MEFLCNLIGFCPRQRRVRDNNVCLCEREEQLDQHNLGSVLGRDVFSEVILQRFLIFEKTTIFEGKDFRQFYFKDDPFLDFYC